MKNRIYLLCLLLCISIAFQSCKKDEGKGGKLTIKGKVYANYYNKSFTIKRYEGYAPDRDVFIMYGDEEFNGDDTKTSYDGTFAFRFLNKGKYRIYVYSTDPKTQLKTTVMKEVDLSKDDVDLGNLVINKLDETNGNFAIRGKLYVNDYDDTYSFIEGSYYGMDEDVYLVQEGDSSYSERVRTNFNGMFEFTGLRKGNYKVYCYSQVSKSSVLSGYVPVEVDVTISNADVMMSDITISRK